MKHFFIWYIISLIFLLAVLIGKEVENRSLTKSEYAIIAIFIFCPFINFFAAALLLIVLIYQEVPRTIDEINFKIDKWAIDRYKTIEKRAILKNGAQWYVEQKSKELNTFVQIYNSEINK